MAVSELVSTTASDSILKDVGSSFISLWLLKPVLVKEEEEEEDDDASFLFLGAVDGKTENPEQIRSDETAASSNPKAQLITADLIFDSNLSSLAR